MLYPKKFVRVRSGRRSILTDRVLSHRTFPIGVQDASECGGCP